MDKGKKKRSAQADSDRVRHHSFDIVQDRDGCIARWSPGAETTYGYRTDEILGRSMGDLIPDGLLGRWLHATQRVAAGDHIKSFRTVHVTRDGDHVDVLVDLEPLNGVPGTANEVLVRVLQVTKRRRTREMLADSDQWARAIVQAAVDAIITINEFGTIEFLNPSAERMFGYKADELIGQNVRILMPSPDREHHDQYLANYRATGHRRIIGIGREVEGQKKDGTRLPLHLSVSEVHLEGRQIFTAILQDISERVQAQREKDWALRDLNKRNIEMTCLYRVGECIRSGDTLNRIFHEIVHLVCGAFSYPSITQARIEFDGDAFSSGPIPDTPWRLTEPIVVGDRNRGVIEVYYREERPAADVGVFLREERDLLVAIASALGEAVERREAEAKVIQASKLASIGELAAGVGHEINNPLNGIINCADIIISNLQSNPRQLKFAELIRSEADRIAKIVRNLLTFSRQDKEHHSPARLCDIVNAVLSLSRKKLMKSFIDLQVNVPADLPKMRCRSEQMQQVVMNLIINAMQALDERYKGPDPNKILSITGKLIHERGQPRVRLTIEDHGTGIAPANMERLFDPFFTTKGRDVGTGLGLSVSDGIVKDHGGQISVESEYGEYTRFHVDLPLNQSADESG